MSENTQTEQFIEELKNLTLKYKRGIASRAVFTQDGRITTQIQVVEIDENKGDVTLEKPE